MARSRRDKRKDAVKVDFLLKRVRKLSTRRIARAAHRGGVARAVAAQLSRGALRSRSLDDAVRLLRAASLAECSHGVALGEALAAIGDAEGCLGALAAAARRAKSARKKDEGMKKFALRLMQRGDPEGADAVLAEAGRFHLRLNESLLAPGMLPRMAPCSSARAFDGVVAGDAVAQLRQALPEYLREHSYALGVLREGRRGGYFSYCCGTDEVPQGALGEAMRAVQAVVGREFPEVAGRAAFVEVWAHSRCPSKGHQFHFDTMDEGEGAKLNPLASCVLYLSGTGGPTAVANHAQGTSPEPNSIEASLCCPRTNRLLFFRGDLLHGVLPGDPNSVNSERRASVMIAFWPKEFPGPRHGAKGVGYARPFPQPGGGRAWADLMLAGDFSPCRKGGEREIGLDGPCKLWQPLSGAPMPAHLPPYDACFQGI